MKKDLGHVSHHQVTMDCLLHTHRCASHHIRQILVTLPPPCTSNLTSYAMLLSYETLKMKYTKFRSRFSCSLIIGKANPWEWTLCSGRSRDQSVKDWLKVFEFSCSRCPLSPASFRSDRKLPVRFFLFFNQFKSRFWCLEWLMTELSQILVGHCVLQVRQHPSWNFS